MKKGQSFLFVLSVLSFLLGCGCFGVGLYSSLPGVKFDLIDVLEDCLIIHPTVQGNRTIMQETLMPLRKLALEQVLKLRRSTGSSIFLLILMISFFIVAAVSAAVIGTCYWNDNYRVSRTSHSKCSSIVFYAGNNEFGVKTHKNINYHSAVGATISADVT
ncbi:hypothetical protein CRE_03281 [Caenorhabditis remanei]|uniref:Uncharacterized protein n=1 Tax=Caenorhabditis remanei TaxID=31234 RepID=E3MME5_CAERE|nr:hypothetical protein CRE_03281 [Caenorhabditis remanei]